MICELYLPIIISRSASSKKVFGLLSTHPTEQLADQLTWHQTQLTTKSWQVTRLAWTMLAVAVCGDLTSGKWNRIMRALETTVFAKMKQLEARSFTPSHECYDSWVLWTLLTVNAASNCYVYAVVTQSALCGTQMRKESLIMMVKFTTLLSLLLLLSVTVTINRKTAQSVIEKSLSYL